MTGRVVSSRGARYPRTMDSDTPRAEALPRAELLRASPPMFESRLLDRFTRVHPAVPPLLFLPAIAVLATLAFLRDDPLEAGPGLVAGYALWTFSEYWIHRIVFHFEPEQGAAARFHWMIHGAHHDHPNDPRRLVMPPVVSLPLASAFFGLFVLVFSLPLAWSITAGFFAGYLAYDMLHYALHHARARGPITRRLRELHMRHHFEDDRRGFAVSAPWWDIVFGTASPRTRRQSRRASATP
jgi:dihydroceramide fatty acyl 2-hydroxylase